MQYITFRLQTDCNQTFHPLSFSIKYVLYFLYLTTPFDIQPTIDKVAFSA